MAKVSGGNRMLREDSVNYYQRQKEVSGMLASGNYSSVEMTKRGGYVAIEKSKYKHKPEEVEAAHILANKGYKVILKNEAGSIKTPDGFLFSASFEQRTPTKDGSNTVRNALFHGRNKGADMVVLFSKNHILTRRNIELGIKMYEEMHDYRFKQIIIVSNNGHIHRYQHNN